MVSIAHKSVRTVRSFPASRDSRRKTNTKKENYNPLQATVHIRPSWLPATFELKCADNFQPRTLCAKQSPFSCSLPPREPRRIFLKAKVLDCPLRNSTHQALFPKFHFPPEPLKYPDLSSRCACSANGYFERPKSSRHYFVGRLAVGRLRKFAERFAAELRPFFAQRLPSPDVLEI